ncbi:MULTISPECIES: exonuclease domain-containing protein [Microbacterium]|uniref:Exonuclease domain-containing protein n=1 Tax=Microbacterium profundi TaxID=450380 RepID=A0ABV3LHJ7_9MICO|nr:MULTISPECIES: exonuclease domain-containing protein [Microbacterium]MCE7481438.1 DNA polymerase III subunit epsilon [Microbacterium profundi]
MSFAVVDFETTGILPSYHHRVVEVGITHVEPDGTISGHWETLINPERDLGPQRIHGIKAAQVVQAPVFSDIAADFAALLQGRVFVAHNASFDLRFLNAEFERSGYAIWGEIPHLCTMRLGAQFGLGGSVALAHACGSFGVENALAHSAGADSLATAKLLAAYLRTTAEAPAWRDYWFGHIAAAKDFPYPQGRTTGVAWQARGDVEEEVHFLQRISVDAKHPRATGVEAEYLGLLDRCLLDRVISVSEARQLASAADELGFSRFEIEDLHAQYYGALAQVAWADGVLTDDEEHDLDAVAELLGIPGVTRPTITAGLSASTGSARERVDAVPMVNAFTLAPGDLIVLTGEMTRPRSDWEDELLLLGYAPHTGITKKVRLLVAADADTLSGKAKKARDYGIPIVDENGLRRLLGNV